MKKHKSTLNLIQDFLRLNDIRRERPLERQEIGQWYSLKQQIEEELFSHPPSHDDRRQSIRLRNLKFSVRFDAGMGAVKAQIQEASEGGMFITTPDPMPVGTEVQVTVEFGDRAGMSDQEVQLPTRVIYTNIGHSLGDGAFTGMGLVITEEVKTSEKEKWFKALDQLLESLMQGDLI